MLIVTNYLTDNEIFMTVCVYLCVRRCVRVYACVYLGMYDRLCLCTCMFKYLEVSHNTSNCIRAAQNLVVALCKYRRESLPPPHVLRSRIALLGSAYGRQAGQNASKVKAPCAPSAM